MPKYKLLINERRIEWNAKNPHLKPLTLKSFAEAIGEKHYQSIRQIYDQNEKSDVVTKYCDLIFISDDKEQIKRNWEAMQNFGCPFFRILKGAIKVLGFEIYDFVTENK